MRLWMYGEFMSVLAVLSLALALFLGASAHAEGPVTNAPDPEHGKVLAERVCSGCHLVSDFTNQRRRRCPHVCGDCKQAWPDPWRSHGADHYS